MRAADPPARERRDRWGGRRRARGGRGSRRRVSECECEEVGRRTIVDIALAHAVLADDDVDARVELDDLLRAVALEARHLQRLDVHPGGGGGWRSPLRGGPARRRATTQGEGRRGRASAPRRGRGGAAMRMRRRCDARMRARCTGGKLCPGSCRAGGTSGCMRARAARGLAALRRKNDSSSRPALVARSFSARVQSLAVRHRRGCCCCWSSAALISFAAGATSQLRGAAASSEMPAAPATAPQLAAPLFSPTDRRWMRIALQHVRAQSAAA